MKIILWEYEIFVYTASKFEQLLILASQCKAEYGSFLYSSWIFQAAKYIRFEKHELHSKFHTHKIQEPHRDNVIQHKWVVYDI